MAEAGAKGEAECWLLFMVVPSPWGRDDMDRTGPSWASQADSGGGREEEAEGAVSVQHVWGGRGQRAGEWSEE